MLDECVTASKTRKIESVRFLKNESVFWRIGTPFQRAEIDCYIAKNKEKVV